MRKEVIEEFREVYAKYFYLKGDDEAYQDICTMDDNRLLYHAIAFAKKYFEDEMKQ